MQLLLPVSDVISAACPAFQIFIIAVCYFSGFLGRENEELGAGGALPFLSDEGSLGLSTHTLRADLGRSGVWGARAPILRLWGP